MSHFKPYPAYRETGVDALGTVPAHWDVRRVASLGALRKANGGTKQDDAEAGVPCVRYGELYTTHDYAIRQTTTFVANDAATDYTAIRYGDVLFAASGETFEDIGKSAVNLMRGQVCCGGDVIVLRPLGGPDPLFLGYALDCSASRAQKAAMGKGFTVIHIYADQLRNLVVAMPPPGEQRTIARAIDREAARIDALIAKKTEFIDLLNTKRLALIAQSVTKGLDSKAKMRSSGVDWLGDVPDHWAVSRLGHFASVENGTTPDKTNPAYWEDGTVPWLGSGEVNQRVITQATSKITDLALRSCSLRLLPVGTVIIGMVGQGKTRGLSAILGIEASINQNMAAICTGPRLRPLFLLHVLTAAYEWIREAGRGSNQAALNCEIVAEFRFAVPPLDEQDEIVAELESALAQLDRLRSKIQDSIDLLRLRRSALITAAVTGQIDLRESA